MHTVYYVMQYDSSGLTQTYTGKIPSSIFVLDEAIYSSSDQLSLKKCRLWWNPLSINPI